MACSPKRPALRGFVFALLAYASWGLLPLYWKYFASVSPLEVVSHRVIWSLFLLAILVPMFRQVEGLRTVLRKPRRLAVLFVTASLLSVNWGIFIYGVVSGQLVQTSLGYFLNPLVSILLAFLFLRERLSLVQIFAVFLAACGVAYFGWRLERLPWIALALAFSFGLYGLLRKMVAVTPLIGLLIETALMTPPALVIIWSLSSHGQAGFGRSAGLTLLFLRYRSGHDIAHVVVHQRHEASAAFHDGISAVSGTDFATAGWSHHLQRTLHGSRGPLVRSHLDGHCPLSGVPPPLAPVRHSDP